MSDTQAKKKKQMLSSYSIVFLVLIAVAILTWFVPQSVVVKNNGTKEIIYNAIMVKDEVVTGQGLQPMGLWDIFMAPIRGFVKAAPVGFAILMAGSFLHLMNYVGAMNSAIGWLLKRFTGKALIIVLMFVSALFGAVYGLWEEIPAYSMVVVPLFVLAGYDVITGIGVLFVGATAGLGGRRRSHWNRWIVHGQRHAAAHCHFLRPLPCWPRLYAPLCRHSQEGSDKIHCPRS